MPAASPARSLSQALEPFVGQVYFSPECHAAYAALGFDQSARTAGGVALPDGPAYFTSRGSLMGQVHGTVVASAFAVFNPAAVIPSVAYGWTLTDAPTIVTARRDGAVAQLRRILGDRPEGIDRAAELLARAAADLRPEGRPLFAGTQAQEAGDDPLGAAWAFGDQLREYRGDVHTAVWTSDGFDACEIGVLTEMYWGLPPRSYSRTRAWSDDQFAVAEERLSRDGLIVDGALTETGRERREAVEVATDEACSPIVDALGDDVDELIGLLSPWSNEVKTHKGYPGSGPQDLVAKLS